MTTLVEHAAARLKSHDWSRRACGIGTKGFRVYDWALVNAGDGHQYVFRRNIDDGELAYFHCYNPRGEPMTDLVRVIGARWPIEECFETAKGEAVQPDPARRTRRLIMLSIAEVRRLFNLIAKDDQASANDLAL